jgi:uncharacterized protein YgfB (UPF0149 family)
MAAIGMAAAAIPKAVAAMHSKYGGGDNDVLDDADKMISLAYDDAIARHVAHKRNHFIGVIEHIVVATFLLHVPTTTK